MEWISFEINQSFFCLSFDPIGQPVKPGASYGCLTHDNHSSEVKHKIFKQSWTELHRDDGDYGQTCQTEAGNQHDLGKKQSSDCEPAAAKPKQRAGFTLPQFPREREDEHNQQQSGADQNRRRRVQELFNPENKLRKLLKDQQRIKNGHGIPRQIASGQQRTGSRVGTGVDDCRQRQVPLRPVEMKRVEVFF